MYGLPKNTEILKQLPKTVLFSKFAFKNIQRETFDADISRMAITHAITKVSLPSVTEGENIKSFYVVELMMKRKKYNPKNIELLFKHIRQNILWILHYGKEVQLAIYYTKLICSDWREEASVSLTLQGLNFDTVWENMVKTVGNIEISEGNSLIEQIREDEERAKLLKQIEVLEKKCRTEIQPHKRRDYFEELKRLKEKNKEYGEVNDAKS